MPLTLQLADARANLGIQAVSGVCHDSDKFRYQVDTVIRQLLKRGAWYGTEVLARFCIYGCNVTFPRYVGTVLGARTCCGQVNITNNWYAIVGPSDCYGLFNSNNGLVDDGQAPVYNDVSGTTGKQIAWHVVKNADVGKTIKIYGFFYGGQPIQEKVNGVWEDGITITAISAGGTPGDPGTVLPAMTPADKLITKITHVVKQATSGMSYLYEYGPDADSVNALRDLAVYEPNELTPMYRRSRVQNLLAIPGRTDAYGRAVRSIDVMVKLEHIPLVSDSDFLLIDDTDAIRYGIQALRKDEAGEFEAAEAFWDKAVRELNFLDRQKTPYNQTAIRVRTGGSLVANPI